MFGLRIRSQKRIVLVGLLRLEGSQRFCRGTRSHDVRSDKPVGHLRCLPLAPLLDERAKYIGKMFVQRPGFVGIDEITSMRNHSMSQLVANHIHRFRKPDKDPSVAVAIAHLLTGPESVVIPASEMHA